MTQHFIVIGNPIAHSKSPKIHTLFAAQTGMDISYQRQYCPNNADSFTAVVEAFFAAAALVPMSLCHSNKLLTSAVRRAAACQHMPKLQAQSIRSY